MSDLSVDADIDPKQIEKAVRSGALDKVLRERFGIRPKPQGK